MKRYGFNYMGSKNAIAERIIDVLPSAENFYDLFCGGFAITHCAMTYGKGKFTNYYCSDVNGLVIECINKCLNGEFANERRWISKEDFDRLKTVDPYVACCFSFGGDWRTYCYSKKIEPVKKALHSAIFDSDVRAFIDLTGVDLSPILVSNDFRERRLMTRRICRLNKLDRNHFDFESCERLESCERFQSVQSLERLNEIIINDQLHISVADYRNVTIKPNSVVYCDIPYNNTSKYQKIDFDYDEFYNWCSSLEADVYVSSYELPEDKFECVAEFNHRSIKSAKTNKPVVEKLFKFRW